MKHETASTLRTVAFICAALLGAPAASQAPPPSGFPGTAPQGPEERIVDFTAEPQSIARGEPATLHWEAINAYKLTIEPGIGTVATRGTLQVEPGATTQYTLTVTGSHGVKSESVTLVVDGQPLAQSASAAAAATREIPRLANGKPDLSGVYLGGRDIRLQAEVQLKPGAERFRIQTRDEDLGQGAACLPPGVPAATMVPYPLQIVQRPDVVVILYEAYNLFRIIPMNVQHPEDLDDTWMGHSVGYWDGDTLVVDVVAFNDRTRVSGYRHTDAMHAVERFRRVDYDTIEYTASVTDPNVFAEPVQYSGNLVLHPEWEIGEYVCAENNKDYAELFTE
jgi:hypothetical protein